MRLEELKIGFMPLVDAAPLIVAAEMGFAEEEGLSLVLEAAPSWSALRDRLCFGQLDAAHMLSPVPVAGALGLGGGGAKLDALAVLSVNGNVIGVSRAVAKRMKDRGHDFGFDDAIAAGKALIGSMDGPLRVGVPFPFSMHAELVYYWLSALGLPAPQNLHVRTVPPPLMADAIKAGEIDAFCVGEPWGSRSVETGFGELLLPGTAIWSFAPEKVLAVRSDWASAEQALGAKLIRAVWRAARWLNPASSRSLVSELMSRDRFLGVPADLIDRALRGRFMINGSGDGRASEGFVEFFAGAAGFPWRSQAEWIGTRLAARTGLDRDASVDASRKTFRSDLFRAALAGVAPDLPSASVKLEGAIDTPTAVGSLGGRLTLPRDSFFDGRIFEPLDS
ncbi:MAG: CmpA/NrtA family ABC transporter substrate-binding protein [Pseudomonadota bacterium]